MLEVLLCLEVLEVLLCLEVRPPYQAAFPWVLGGHPSELLCLEVLEVRDHPEELAFPLEPCRPLEVHCLALEVLCLVEAELARPSIAFTSEAPSAFITASSLARQTIAFTSEAPSALITTSS